MIMADAKKSERGSRVLKFLDRYVGIPLVFILGFLKIFNKNKIPQNIKKIAILKTAAIGDTVLLTGIIKDLKKEFPLVEIHFYSGSSNYGFSKLITDCKKVIQLPLKNFKKLYQILKSDEYDVLLDFGAWPRINSVCSYFINAKYKIGFKTEGQYRHYVYDFAVEHSNKIHELENYRNIIRALNITPATDPTLPEGNDVSELLSGVPGRYVVCHLWAGGEKSYLKEWPKENWQKLMVKIIKEKRIEIILTGGQEDKSKNLDFISMFSQKNHIHDLSGRSLSETISVLKKSQCVISVNTGVMHMAAGLGVKTIGLHGPTSIKRWGPVGKDVHSVASNLPGAQYLNLGFEYQPDLDCMKHISIDEVWSAVSKTL